MASKRKIIRSMEYIASTLNQLREAQREAQREVRGEQEGERTRGRLEEAVRCGEEAYDLLRKWILVEGIMERMDEVLHADGKGDD